MCQLIYTWLGNNWYLIASALIRVRGIAKALYGSLSKLVKIKFSSNGVLVFIDLELRLFFYREKRGGPVELFVGVLWNFEISRFVGGFSL